MRPRGEPLNTVKRMAHLRHGGPGGLAEKKPAVAVPGRALEVARHDGLVLGVVAGARRHKPREVRVPVVALVVIALALDKKRRKKRHHDKCVPNP